MKFGNILLCMLLGMSSVAWADIYKAVDADGHVTYSSVPLKGGKRVAVTPQPTTSSPAASHSSATPHNFPKVDQETQKGRDGSRRKILEDELRMEEDLLGMAKKNLQAGQEQRPRDEQKMKELTKQVDIHQGNVAALNTELAKVK